MHSRALRHIALACLTAGVLLPGTTAQAAAAATTAGGTAASDSSAATTQVTPAAAPFNGGGTPTQSVQSGPNTLQPPAGGTLLKRPVQLHGELTGASAHRRVLVQLLDPRHGWSTVARATADAHGDFTASWRPQRVGRFKVRAIDAGQAHASATGGPTAVLEVLKPVRATWFGPTNKGPNQTACGQTLTPQLLGIAHRTLPCGTLVDVTYNGHTLALPVVDRGPFVRGVTIDLTQGAAQALGFDGSEIVGALAITG